MYNCGIYKITNTINNKFYIGSSYRIKQRWKEHAGALKNGKHNNIRLQLSYNKHGKSSFTYEILCFCAKKDLSFYEQRFLDKYWDDGVVCYNICKDVTASMRDRKHSEETKLKMSEDRKGEKNNNYGKTWSEEHKKKYWCKENNPMFGKPSPNKGKKIHSEEVKKVLSERRKEWYKLNPPKHGEEHFNHGKKRTEEEKQKQSLAMTGKKMNHSEETLKKMSDRVTGENNPMFGKRGELHPMFGKPGAMLGKTLSDERKQKMSEHQQKLENRLSHAKLTVEQVNEIRLSTDPQKVIAAKFGICQTQVSRIKRGIRWKGVK